MGTATKPQQGSQLCLLCYAVHPDACVVRSVDTQVKEAPRSLSQALQAAQPLATLPHPNDTPPHAQAPLPNLAHPQAQSLCQQQQQQLSRSHQIQQTYQQQASFSQKQAQAQQQKQLQGQLEAGKQLLPSASEAMSQEPSKLQATAAAAQQEVGPDPDICLAGRPEPDQDVPISQQSHVSPSPSSCRTDRSDKGQELQQQQQPSQASTLADSAVQSSHVAGASHGQNNTRRYNKQPLQGVLSDQQTAAALSPPGQVQASVRNGKAASPTDFAAESQLALSAKPAALDPAGPVSLALQRGSRLPAASGSNLQLPNLEQQGSAALMQQHKAGPQPAGSKQALQAAAGQAAKRNPRDISCMASAAPAESQQSAVDTEHAGLCRSKHVQRADANMVSDSMQATGSVADGHTASSRAKRARPEADVADAKKWNVEQARKRGRPRLQTVCHAGNGHELGRSAPQAADGNKRHNDPQKMGSLQEHADRCKEEGKIDVPTSTSGKNPTTDNCFNRPSNSKGKVDIDSRIISKGVQSAKRSLRQRDGDGNKPWWVV